MATDTPSAPSGVTNDGRPGLADYALLVLLSAIWGSSFMLIDIGVESLPAATLTAGRLAVAALVLLGVVALMRAPLPRSPKVLGLLLASAIFGNALPFTLISWGQETIPSGLAAILMATMPLITVALAHLLTDDEKLSTAKVVGVLFGFVGLIVLMGPQNLWALGDETVRQLAVAGAAVSYAVNTMVTRAILRTASRLDRRAMAGTVMGLAAAIMLPIAALANDWSTLAPTATGITATVVLGVLQTAIATLLMFAVIARQGASFFSQLNFLVPLFGVAYGALFLSERLPSGAFLALGLILAGIAIARRGMGRTPGRTRGRTDASGGGNAASPGGAGASSAST